jgi:hypothetical protein
VTSIKILEQSNLKEELVKDVGPKHRRAIALQMSGMKGINPYIYMIGFYSKKDQKQALKLKGE